MHICMIVQQRDVQGGIAAVVDGYYGSRLERDYRITYIESYCDGTKPKKLVKALRAYAEFFTVLGGRDVDLVHIHSSFGPSFWRKLPFIFWSVVRKAPVVNHIHGAEFDAFYTDASRLKKLIIRKAYQNCARLIVLSDAWKKRMRRLVSAERICVVPNYGMARQELLKRETSDARFAHRQVLFLGEIGRRKGAYDIPAIIRKVRTSVTDARFLIAGEGEIEAVRQMLHAEDKDAVTFPGWVRGKEKEEALSESTVFLLPSYQEGMPMSILDAMSYGLPVVSTTVGGIPEMMGETEAGILCRPGDTEEIAKALTLFLTDKALFEKAGTAGLNMVRDRFSLERHIEQLEAVYEEVLR